MSRTLRLDSVGGASGDMILACLIDLGADLDKIKSSLTSLNIDNYDILSEKLTRNGFCGTRIDVQVSESHHHRNLDVIRTLIADSNLSERVKSDSTRIFEQLAEAEAKVHNTTPDKIHFHEVGAMDSIIDIVGACIALELLDIETIICSPLPLGSGTVNCAHGIIPVPVPATVELLKGRAVIQTDEPFELVTPTGAALIVTLSSNLQSAPSGQQSIDQAGIGFGKRELNNRPNLLRATILSTSSEIDQPCPRSCYVLETNLDDTNPELIGSLTDKLMTQGALDVFTTSVQMKKQRPGTLLSVLCDPENRDKLMDTIFTESTTFGVREYITHRTCLERKFVEADTPYGVVKVKVGIWKDREITRAPEHSDCVRCAEEHNVPVRTVYEAAVRASS